MNNASEKYQLKIVKAVNQKEITLEILRNPFIGMVGTFIIVEALQKAGYMGSVAGTVLEGAVASGAMITAYGKAGAFEALATGLKQVPSLLQSLPLLAAAGA